MQPAVKSLRVSNESPSRAAYREKMARRELEDLERRQDAAAKRYLAEREAAAKNAGPNILDPELDVPLAELDAWLGLPLAPAKNQGPHVDSSRRLRA